MRGASFPGFGVDKGPERKRRSRKERFKRRDAGRDEGPKQWMLEEKFADYLATWREKEYVREMRND